tara:strand:+ start:1062 stop:1322 length:261 start_codon:yes stop_codon:yes gene_type:complete
MSTFIGATERRRREKVSISQHRRQALAVQKPSIKQLESENYVLWFVRRIDEDNRLVVMHKHNDSADLAVIYYDGEIDRSPKLKLRG